MDEPTTFWFDGKPYSPKNFEDEFTNRNVSLRYALAHSLNVATVKVAEMVGYDAVVDMANRAGMNYKIQPTPAVALGAYEITPLEAAGAYTMFANEGKYVKPDFLSVVRDDKGNELYAHKAEEKQVLDPRVAYLMTNLLEEVLRSGTAAGARAPPASTCPRRARPALRATAGSPATPPSCSAWCGWASTTTAIWTWKARTPPRPSGCSS